MDNSLFLLDREGILPKIKDDQCRCMCGSLVARLVPDGIEIKCKRCKHLVVIPVEEIMKESEFLPENYR